MRAETWWRIIYIARDANINMEDFFIVPQNQTTALTQHVPSLTKIPDHYQSQMSTIERNLNCKKVGIYFSLLILLGPQRFA